MLIRIVDTFICNGKTCIITEVCTFFENYHNGYVEKIGEIDDEKIPEEITYCGKLDHLECADRTILDLEYVGFDTMHFDDNAETQSLEAVIRRTKVFANSF